MFIKKFGIRLLTIVCVVIGGNAVAFTLTSSAFNAGSVIPREYTCDGSDLSPPLAWIDAPESTKSFALIMDDPDAPVGLWTHWVLWNIPANLTQFSKDISLPIEIMQGQTSWGNNNYGGPCPPDGQHRYFFHLYALDTLLNIPATSTQHDLLKAMEGHILAQTELMGLYKRP